MRALPSLSCPHAHLILEKSRKDHTILFFQLEAHHGIPCSFLSNPFAFLAKQWKKPFVRTVTVLQWKAIYDYSLLLTCFQVSSAPILLKQKHK